VWNWYNTVIAKEVKMDLTIIQESKNVQVDYKILGTLYECWDQSENAFLSVYWGPQIFRSLEKLKAKYPNIEDEEITKVNSTKRISRQKKCYYARVA